MRILYVASKYDYGKPEQGYSFEHHNFYNTLLNMGHDILYFDFMTLMQQHDQAWMNRRLVEVVKAEKPALMFTVLFQDQLSPDAVKEISQNTDTTTFNWFTDDHWRFDDFSYRWATCFNWVSTTAQSALPKYANIGYHNVIKTQWACNPYLYQKLDLPLVHDVTFVGQPHGNRRQVIQALRDAGIKVQVWGNGWESGRLSQDEMIRVFNQSRINLNLSNAMTSGQSGWKYVLRKLIAQTLNQTTIGRQFKTVTKQFLFRAQGQNQRLASNTDQIKGRNFEVPGCGGMMLTGHADNLEQYYAMGKEIDCFDTVNDLIGKIRYYLQHEDARAALANAGYQRTSQEHTYIHRFTEIFQRIGLPHTPISEITARIAPLLGTTQDIN